LLDLISLPESSTDSLSPRISSSATLSSSSPPATVDARDLLAQFASTGQQEPFEEVVRRYGGMVFNLCFEVTGNRHDAEDAVQAAFLSLAVQAKSGQSVQAIGPWLQQVARRMSLDINRSRRRRKNREERHGETWERRMSDVRADGNGGSGSHGNPASAAGWEELRTIVQQELAKLPPKYRMPLILHYFGGLSREEMARELNCRANTLGVRLHRGREMLSKRLAKRGVALSGVVMGVIMTEVVRSIVTERLVSSTAHAAVLLSAGHPYACGVVAPQIVAMAQTAGRALANAKLRFGAILALLAGGAAAAGGQVLSHGNWTFSRPGNWGLDRVYKWLFNPPSLPTRVVDATDQKRGTPVADHMITAPTPGIAPRAAETRTVTAPIPIYRIDWSAWGVQLPSNPATPQPFTVSPVVNGDPPGRSIPRPVIRAINTPTVAFAAPGVRGGGNANNDGGGSSKVAVKNKQTNTSDGLSNEGVATNNDNQTNPAPKDKAPDRGGVKHPLNDTNVVKQDSPKPSSFVPRTDNATHYTPPPQAQPPPEPTPIQPQFTPIPVDPPPPIMGPPTGDLHVSSHGRLDLPPIAVEKGTHTYTWGGTNDPATLTLVNSARLTFHDVRQDDASVGISLLALDREDIPALPPQHHFIGVWSFDQHDLTADGGMDLLVRYDDVLAAEKGLSEDVLKLWVFNGQWERLDFDPTFLRDSLDHTLFVHTDATDVTYFAVSAPEPATMGMIAAGLSFLTLGRRRRRRSPSNTSGHPKMDGSGTALNSTR
jgi:RNA polymerase sigma factor (sigma-70 family)